MEVDNFVLEIQKHMVSKFSVLELHIITVWGMLLEHVLVLILLEMNQICTAMKRLKVNVHGSIQRAILKIGRAHV